MRCPVAMQFEEQASEPLVTVFTPTFNREPTLGRLYESLRQQRFTEFEWLVVDDGSSDGTAELLYRWSRAGDPFPIRYVYKENGGKHTAHNLALTLARGRYFAVMDSDDWYAPDAIGVLVEEWEAMDADRYETTANVEGLCAFGDGTLIGSPFPGDRYVSDNYSIAGLRRQAGDTCGMYRTAVLREFPFPDGFDGQLVPESLVWNRIARCYRTMFLNRVTGFKEYRADGLTRGGGERRLRSTESLLLYYRELLEMGGRGRFRNMANLVRLSLRAGKPADVSFPASADVWERFAAAVAGRMLYLRDRMRGMT